MLTIFGHKSITRPTQYSNKLPWKVSWRGKTAKTFSFYGALWLIIYNFYASQRV